MQIFLTVMLFNACGYENIGTKPEASTRAATEVKPTQVTLNGEVNPNGALTTITFEYGKTQRYGNEVEASVTRTAGSDLVLATATLSGLDFGQTYHARIKAVNGNGAALGDDIVFIPFHAIGSSLNGGRVAYVLQPNDPGFEDGNPHGLLILSQHVGFALWSGSFNFPIVTGAIAKKIGTGAANTEKIVLTYNDPTTAASICSDLKVDGFDDWFLPSLDELKALDSNAEKLGLLWSEYWTSTEDSDFYAWGFAYSRDYFGVSTSYNRGSSKRAGFKVMPMRYF